LQLERVATHVPVASTGKIPVLSAHPGRSMDDGGKQVSWLVAEVLASPSRPAGEL
jgi:hypothetical protein